MYKKLNVMDYDIFDDDLSSIYIDQNKKQIINTINPHSFITAKSDEAFAKALNASHILLPDGSGIVMAAKYINKKKIKKIAGADLHTHLLHELNNINGKCFYMGASQDTLDKIHNKIIKEFPNVVVNSFSPPFKKHFSEEENKNIISKINEFNPDVLFIGMTAPKQEKWLHAHHEQLNFKVASSIGAVFDFYAGTVKRPSKFWIKTHLEWLPRLVKEPKRLWRRNFISTPKFLFHMVKSRRKR